MNPSTSRFALRNLLLAAAASIAPLAHSATLYWDGTSSTANADGGTGTWDVSTLVWDTLATAGSDSAWVDGSDASFAGTAGTVTVSGSFALNSLSISSGYTLTGGTLTIGGKTITTSGAGNSADIFINSVLAGTGGITLAANGDTSASGGGVGGSLKLGGANTFTGGVTITSGVVNIDSNFGDASNTITLNGGGLVDEGTSTTFTRNIIIGSSGGVIRSWGSTPTFTGTVSGTGTLRRTDWGTQNYTGNFTGSVSLNNQRETTNLTGNWLSSGSAFASSGTLNLRGQVYDGAAIVNTGGALMISSINRNSVQLSATGGSIGLGRTAAMGMGATYNVASGTVLGASTGAWLDSSKFAAGYNYSSNSGTGASLFGSTALNVRGSLSGIHNLYTGTFTSTADMVTDSQGFYAPNATFSLSTGRLDIWGGPLVVGALTGSGNITVNGGGRGDVGVYGNFYAPTYIGSVSQNKSVALVGRINGSAIIVGSNNASTTYSGLISNGSWSGGTASLLKRGTGTLTLTGGSSSMSGGLIVEQGRVILQTGGGFPGTAYYGTNLAVLKGATLSTNAGYALSYTQNMYVLGGTFSYLSGDIYSPNLILDGGTVANASAGNTGGFRFGYNADGYINVLSGLGASTLSGRFQLFGNGRTEFIRVSDGAAARDLVVNANLADDPSFTGLRITKTGLGTMAFTAASSRSGGTTINAGTVEIAAANALGTGATAGITMGGGTLAVRYDLGGSQNSMAYVFGGGTLQLSGNTTAVTQGIGAVTINNGSATITAAPGAGGTTTVNIGNITRSGTATQALLNLNGTATWTTTQANDATKGRLLGVLLNGGFARNDGANNIVAYSGTQISGTTIAAGATTDYVIGASVTGNLSMAAAGTTTIQSLTLDSTAGRTVEIGAGNTLRVVDGIFQKTSGVALNFNNTGTLTGGSADNTAADLLIYATGGLATGTNMQVASVIANNGTGAVTLVKSGVGSVQLTGTNTYTGGTIIGQGRLVVGGSANVGSGTITVNDGGQLYATGNITNAITLNGGIGAQENAGYLGAVRLEAGVNLSGALTVNNDSQVTTYGGSSTISGAVTLNGELVKTGAGTLTMSAGNSGNGTLYVKEGTVIYSGDYLNKNVDIFIGAGATVSHVAVNGFQGNLLTIAGGTYTTSAYHGKLTNVNLYGGAIVGTGSGKYNGEDAGFGTADTTVFVGGSTFSRIDTPNKINLNATRFYVQDATGNSAADLIVRGSFAGTGYFGGLGTTRFARQNLGTGSNTNHTANTFIQAGHTLEVASEGSMGTGTITLDGGTMRMTSLAGLAEYRITGTSSMNTTSAGTFIGVTRDDQHLNDNSSGTFGDNITWSYRGQLVITDASRTIKFSEQIDDAAWVRVSGTSNSGTVVDTVVLNDAGWNTNTTNSITLTAGTYNLDVRGQNGGGGYGPSTNVLNGLGVAWDINNGTAWTSVGATNDTGVQVYAAGNLSQTLANSISLARLSNIEVLDSTDTVTLTGVVSGAGMLNKTGNGVLVLSGANTFSGGLTVTGGELRVAASGSLGTGSINLLSGSTLAYSGASNATFANAMIAERGDASINVSNAAATLTLAQGIDNYASGAATRTITKTGAGSLTIAGLLTGKHLFSVSAGALTISATDASRASANVATGTTLNVSASGTFGAVTNAGTSTLSSTTLGAVTNTAGTLTANSATTLGNVTNNGGTLTANSATTLGNVTVSGGTLNATAATAAGTLAISGGTTNLASGSYGATTLSNGTLNLGAATLASINKTGGTLNIGAVGTAATLTATGNSALGGVLNFDLSNSISSGNDLLAVGGTVDLSNLTGVTFNLVSGALVTGNYTLVSSSGITAPAFGIEFVSLLGIASSGSRQTYTLSTTTITNALTLDVAGSVGYLTFANGGNDTWSTADTDGAWTTTSTDQWFFNGDGVTFSDLASTATKTVTVSGDVSPGSTTFDNTSGTTYTLTGTGRITGTTGLTKSGNGRLVLGNTGGNDFTGATTVSNGTLEIGAANALSTSSALTINGGSLDVAAITSAVAGTVTLSSGSIVGTTGSLSASSLTVTGGTLDANLSGTGTLTFNGAGQSFTYGKTASHTGGTTLTAGTLTVSSTGSVAGAFTQSAGTTLNVDGSLTGGTLSIGSSATTNVGSTGSLSAVTLASGAALNSQGTITGNIANSGVVTFAGSTDRTYGANITGSGSIIKTGDAALTLSGTNTATAGLSIQGGKVVVNSAGALGSINTTLALGTTLQAAQTVTYAGTLTLTNNATLQVDSGVTFTRTGGLTGGKTLTISGSGATNFQSYGSGAFNSSSLNITGGTVRFNSGYFNNNIGLSAITVNSGATLVTNTAHSMGGYLTSSPAITINSGGTLTLNGEQYLSTIVMNGGLINGGNEVRADNGFTVTVNGDATWAGGLNLVQTNYNLTVASGATLTQSGYISNSRGIRKSGAGTLVLSGTNNSFGDGVLVYAGTVSAASVANGTLGTSYLALQGGTFAYTGTGAETTTRALWVDNGTGTFDITSATGDVTFSSTAGTLSRAITKTGAGALTLADDISGTGAVTVSAGTLTLNGAGTYTGGLALGGSRVNLGTASAGGSGAVTLSADSTIGVTSGVTATQTTLSGTGNLTKVSNGTLALSGTNSLTGNVAVTGGTLAVNGADSFGHTGTTSVSSGATLAIGSSVSDIQTGAITNAGTLANAGVTARSVTTSGTFANSGTAGDVAITSGSTTNSGTLGAITQTGGTLASTGTVGNVTATSSSALGLSGTAGAVSVTSSTLNVGGSASTSQLSASSLTLGDGAVIEFEMSDATNTSFYDRLTLSGGLDLSQLTTAATLKLYSFNRAAGVRGNATSFDQYANFSIDIITASSVTGTTLTDAFFGTEGPSLTLDTTGFTNTFTGTWALVDYEGGYRLEYTANTPITEINTAVNVAFADTAEGPGFLEQIANTSPLAKLKKTGIGTLTISEALTHTGGTQVVGGTLTLAGAGALGTGIVTIDSGATLDLAASGTTIENAFAGAGNIVKSGEGRIDLTGAVGTTGSVTINNGTLAASFQTVSGNVAIASGATAVFLGDTTQSFTGSLSGQGTALLADSRTLTIAATNAGFSGTFSVDDGRLIVAADNAAGLGTVALATAGTLEISGGRTVAASVSGQGAVVKSGTGTATLSGALSYTGTTTVSNGTLKGDFTNTLGAIAVGTGASLEYAIASDATRGGSDITGLGSFTKSGNGKLSLSSALGVTGGVSITGGTLAAADFGTASTVSIGANTTAELNLASSTTLATVFAGTGTFTKTGNNTLTIGSTGLSTFAGKVRVTQGTVSTAAIANLGTTASSIELDGGALAVTASGQTLGSTRAITVGSAGATINTSSLGQTGTLTVDSLISGTGTLTLAGSGNTSASGGGDAGLGIRLTNASNSFTGDVVITSGLVSYTSNAAFGNSANKIVLNGGGLLDNNGNVALSRNIEVQSGGGVIRFWGSNNATFSGSLSGSGALSHTDAGTLSHTGDLSGFTGTYNNYYNSVTLFTGSAAALGAATVNVSAGTVGFADGRMGAATVNLDGGTLRFESAGAQSSANVKFVSGKTGYVNTNGNNVTLANGITGSGSTLEKSGTGTLTLQGTGTATLSSAINAVGGTLEVAGQTASSSTAWINGGTLKVSSGAVTASSYIMIGTGTLEIAGGTLNTDWIRTGEGASTVSTINQSGGTFNVTGTNTGSPDGRYVSFTLSHWNSTTNYNLSGGTLNVLNVSLNMGWDGTAFINQSGGTANLRGINFANGRGNTAAYNLTGGRLNIGAGGITSAANKTVTLGNATVGALANWTGASAMSINAGTTTTFDTTDAADGTTARTITLSGAVNGTGSLVKTGNGTLTLSGANGMSGSITANAGTLNINGTVQGASSITASNGTTVNFNVNNFLTAGHGAVVADSRTLTATGGSTLVFGSGTEARLGNINLSGSTLTSNRGLSSYDMLLANVDSGAATVTVTGTSASTMNGTGGLHLSGVQNFSVADATSNSSADLVVSMQLSDGGIMGGLGGINKTGAGTMSLTNANNNFTGDITVGAGTLEVSGAGRLNNGSYAGTVTNNGALNISTSANQTLSGAVSGAGSLTKSGNGTLTLSGSNTHSGATDITGGKVVVSNANSLGSGSYSIGANATLSLGFSIADGSSFASTLTGTGLFEVGGAGTFSLANASGFTGTASILAGSFDMTGFTGQVRLEGGTLANLGSYAGTLEVGSGSTLDVSNLPDAANVVLRNGGTLNFGGSARANSIVFQGGSLSNAENFTGNIVVTGTGVNIGAGALGRGTLVVGAGTSVNFTGANSNTINANGGRITGGTNFTGTIVASSGNFKIGAGTGQVGIDTLSDGATVSLGGATLDLSGSSSAASIAYSSGSITNAANFTGTVTLAAGSNLTMNTTIGGTIAVSSGATLSGSGTFNNVTVADGGTLSPGNSPGIQTFTGSLVLDGGSSWDVQIYSTEAVLINGDVNGEHVGARGYDTIQITGGDFFGGGSLDLSGATSIDKITLNLMTLANWEDSVGDIPTHGLLEFAPGQAEQTFVLATYAGSATLAAGETFASIFAFNTSGYYMANGQLANSSQFSVSEFFNDGTNLTELTLTVVPEPSTYGMILGGLALAAAAIRRRRQTKA